MPTVPGVPVRLGAIVHGSLGTPEPDENGGAVEMTIKIVADDSDDIEFEVKGKISLSLTRKGMIYRNKLVEDGGEALRLMTKFLGLAEESIQNELHEEVVTHVPNEQARLDALREQKSALLIIQKSQDGQDDGRWENLFEADVPEWVKEADCMSDMMKGVKVKANDGGYWYRAIHVVPAKGDDEVGEETVH
jgi:hypothetical protein